MLGPWIVSYASNTSVLGYLLILKLFILWICHYLCSPYSLVLSEYMSLQRCPSLALRVMECAFMIDLWLLYVPDSLITAASNSAPGEFDSSQLSVFLSGTWRKFEERALATVKAPSVSIGAARQRQSVARHWVVEQQKYTYPYVSKWESNCWQRAYRTVTVKMDSKLSVDFFRDGQQTGHKVTTSRVGAWSIKWESLQISPK